MIYRVHKPSPALSGRVDYLWHLRDAAAHARERIVPSGTLELVINLHDDEFRIFGVDGMNGCRRFPGAVVSGCYGGPFAIDTRAHASIIGVHFKPGGAAGFLGAPPGEIADSHVGLDDLWGSRAAELRERLCQAGEVESRFGILEQALIASLSIGAPSRPGVRASLPLLDRPGVEVGEVTGALGLSRRRFIELFTEDVGMTPKRYSRVRRFQRALTLATGCESLSWSEFAVECGYFDQAHLCREWSEFTGFSPSAFAALRATRVKDHHVALPPGGVKSVQYGRAAAS